MFLRSVLESVCVKGISFSIEKKRVELCTNIRKGMHNPTTLFDTYMHGVSQFQLYSIVCGSFHFPDLIMAPIKICQ